MDIKVLGIGCSRCHQLEMNVFNVLAEMNVDANLDKVEDVKQIMAYKVMGTPALVINGKVKVAGRVPNPAEIKRYITEEL